MVNARGRPKAPLILSPDERLYLERQVRRRRVARSLSERCRVILRCADGMPSKTRLMQRTLDSHDQARARIHKSPATTATQSPTSTACSWPPGKKTPDAASMIRDIPEAARASRHFLASEHLLSDSGCAASPAGIRRRIL